MFNMSEPVELQRQLADAFGRKSRVLDLSGSRENSWPPEEDIIDPVSDFEQIENPHEPSGSMRRALAGSVFLLAAVSLMVGMQYGSYLISALVVAIGILGAIFLLRDMNAKPEKSVASPSKEMQEQMRDQMWEHNESVNLLSSVHDMMGDIVLARMLDGRILSSNTVYSELTGTDDLTGKTCEQLGIRFEKTSKLHQYDATVPTLTGDRIFAWHDIVIRDPTTGNLVIRSIARDVTEEREQAKQKDTARILAERQSAAKSQLLATVSHEIRTPLAGILGMGQLLSQTRMTPDQSNYLDGVRQSGTALMQLVDDLLDYSAMEAGRFELHPQVQSLRPIVENVVEMLAPRAHAKGIEIAATISSSIPDKVSVDAPRLRQVLFNIIGNAVKFTTVGGVLIDIAHEESALIIAVSDTGPGMSESDKLKIFDEFEQVGLHHEKSGGTGLGLAISTRLIHAFGGILTVDSSKGAGSRFTITIPAFFDNKSNFQSVHHAALKYNRVMLLAPLGIAANALCKTIIGLGGECYIAHSVAEAISVIQLADSRKRPLTDIVVDHRCRDIFEQELVYKSEYKALSVRRVFLVNPEERSHLASGPGYDSWLIRPLREQSLVDVLCGRMKGIELRDALNDNRRTFVPPLVDIDIVNSSGLDIILAEDDPINAFLVKTLLLQKGHRVRHFSDFGSLANELFDANKKRPDLLLTDMSMPGGSGHSFVASIRKGEEEQHLERLPVLVLTADRKIHVLEAMLGQGADSIIQKPVDPEMLMSLINDLTEHQPHN